MFNFFRKRSKSDAYLLEILESYVNKDKYFVRVARFMELGFNQGTITVIDPHGPRMITMDPWLETIFLNATGLRTVKHILKIRLKTIMATIPSKLDSYIISELEKLVFEHKIIEFRDVPNVLKPPFERGIPQANK